MKRIKILSAFTLSAAALLFSAGCNGGVENEGTLEDDAAVETGETSELEFGEADVDAGVDGEAGLEE